ncbi:MAG TPA: cytochrome c biogenesis protein CcsA [Bacteroidota bacterium]|nr:cytochrome c biogenesis protein CcsA [Bacteroidota bacterium]
MLAGAIGSILIKAAFLAGLSSVFLYFRIHQTSSNRFLPLARISFHLTVMSLMTASAVLLYLILTHQFQYTYVWNYSSTDLPLPLLISTFYAGQEGSFMLWALFTALIGVFLMQYSGKKEYEPEVMSVYSLILSFLMLMLIVKNPFTLIWESFPNDLVQSGAVPPGITNYVVLDAARNIYARYPLEGKGLNPLLQNYWMVIHPQILFLGFSAMAVPYAHAVAGLLKRDYSSWIRVATPWSVFGAMTLGTGIILGGYWAYETLGWGGFWGWDPVENSSLVPWLLCVASIHTTLVQRKSGAFVKTNFFLSTLTFIGVLYSTFLTRSGVLGETSVHSFVDPGMWVYWLLLACIALFATIGLGLLFTRMREMPKIPVEHSIMSREFALYLGAAALTFVAIFVAIGTSSPIITSILKGKASAVEISYYIKTNLPLGIAITFLSGLGQLLWWRHSQTDTLLRTLVLPVLLGMAATGAVLLMGWEEFEILLFTFCAAFSLFANVQVGYGIYRGNPKFVGGSVAHIGIAIMCLGFVTSERYDDKATAALEQGKPSEVLGYTMTYVGYRPIERDKYAFNIEVETKGRKHVMAPTMYYSEFTKGLMRNPDLINFISKDLYVAPLSVEEGSAGNEQQLTLQKGAEQEVGNVKVAFDDFDFSSIQRGAMLEGGEFTIGVILTVKEGKKKTRVVLTMKNSPTGPQYIPATYTANDKREYTFNLLRMMPDRDDKAKSTVEIAVQLPPDNSKPAKGETLVIEASVKPMINLVWMGTVTLIVGFVLTIIRRAEEARLKERWIRNER